jgi:hypothetical protein
LYLIKIQIQPHLKNQFTIEIHSNKTPVNYNLTNTHEKGAVALTASNKTAKDGFWHLPEAVFCCKNIVDANKTLQPDYTLAGNVYQLVIPKEIYSFYNIHLTMDRSTSCLSIHFTSHSGIYKNKILFGELI